MDNESDGEEERDLEAIREQGKVNNSNSSIPVPNEIEKDEPEDVKPDINSINTSNRDAERSEDHENSPSNATTSGNTYNNSHNTFQVPGQQQLYNQQQQSYNSYGSLNTQFYNSMQMQQQLMLQQMHQQQQQQNLQQQSTSHNNFYGSESRPDVASYPQAQAQETQPQKEYKVNIRQKLSVSIQRSNSNCLGRDERCSEIINPDQA